MKIKPKITNKYCLNVWSIPDEYPDFYPDPAQLAGWLARVTVSYEGHEGFLLIGVRILPTFVIIV